MKKFLKRHGLWALFAIAVIAVTMAVLSYFSTTSSPLANAAGIVAAPFRAGFTAVADWFNDKQAYYADSKALQAENEELKKQLADMEAQIRQSEADSAENARLRQLLNLRPQKHEFTLESATIVERDSSNWTDSITLNRGTDHGVAAKDCVITAENFLVGVVSEVGKNWCTVLLLTDTDTEMGALVYRSNEIGIAQGDFNLMSERKLKLSYVSSALQLLNGDLIVTSGLGGYYPSGLVIGSIGEMKLEDSGSTQYAIVEPAADFASLSQVFIIKAFDIVE